MTKLHGLAVSETVKPQDAQQVLLPEVYNRNDDCLFHTDDCVPTDAANIPRNLKGFFFTHSQLEYLLRYQAGVAWTMGHKAAERLEPTAATMRDQQEQNHQWERRQADKRRRPIDNADNEPTTNEPSTLPPPKRRPLTKEMLDWSLDKVATYYEQQL
jgi:hypothetical protein